MKFVFWISVGLILYTYVGYPILLIVLASVRQTLADLRYAANRGDRRPRRAEGRIPAISIVFAAHNEQAVIERKMRNCEGLLYPAQQLEILVGCDGCTDQTAKLAAATLPAARVFDYPERSGKPAVLNRLAAAATGDLLVFCDANTMLQPDSLDSLARHFTNPAVGCVCGELRLISPDGQPGTESWYWRYEAFLKLLEGRMQMLVGANGAIFAVRRELYTTLPSHGIVDDFLLSMRIRAAGYRMVYDPEAVAFEETAPTVKDEMRRRRRIGAGNFHALRMTGGLLAPTAGWIALSYFSHKLLRWLVPFLLPLAFLSALVLARQPLYGACALAGAALVALSLVGYGLEQRNIHRRLFAVPYYFLSMNLGLLLGFVAFLRNSQDPTWRPTPRGSDGLTAKR